MDRHSVLYCRVSPWSPELYPLTVAAFPHRARELGERCYKSVDILQTAVTEAGCDVLSNEKTPYLKLGLNRKKNIRALEQ